MIYAIPEKIIGLLTERGLGIEDFYRMTPEARTRIAEEAIPPEFRANYRAVQARYRARVLAERGEGPSEMEVIAMAYDEAQRPPAYRPPTPAGPTGPAPLSALDLDMCRRTGVHPVEFMMARDGWHGGAEPEASSNERLGLTEDELKTCRLTGSTPEAFAATKAKSA